MDPCDHFSIDSVTQNRLTVIQQHLTGLRDNHNQGLSTILYSVCIRQNQPSAIVKYVQKDNDLVALFHWSESNS